MTITAEEINSVNASNALQRSGENGKLINILIRAVVSGDDSELVRHCKEEADAKTERNREFRASIKRDTEFREKFNLPDL